MNRRTIIVTTIILLCLVLLGNSGNAYGQYFGRNKVRYERFDYKVMRTDNFLIHYYPAESLAVADAARMLERWKVRLDSVFGRPLKQEQPIILYANHADFQQTNVIGGIIPQGTGGVTEGLKSRIILPLTGISSEDDHVLGHELVHAYQFQMFKNKQFGGLQMPLWFIEGMAEYYSIGSHSPLTAMWMRDAVLQDKLPGLSRIGKESRYFPYRYGHAVLAYIGGRWGDDAATKTLDSVVVRGWKKGVQRALGISLDSLSKDWRSATKEAFAPGLVDRTKPAETGKRLVAGEGGFNISPVLSPDGKHLAYMSARGLFGVDLYLADARTGKTLKKLLRANSDTEYDALRFFQSTGAWSPDAKTFAFVVFRKGDNAISLVDVATRSIKQTIVLPEVDEIQQLSWSPDGQTLLFSGTRGGISDLFTYDFSTKAVKQLTDDRYSDAQPTWSPDGKSIAFVTDRGENTSLDSLIVGKLKLGFLELATGDIQVHAIAPQAKHINPQFSTDGKSVYLIADPDGYSDVYRYDRENAEFSRVTKVATGVSGLTEVSPALSVAAGRVAFSVFDGGQYAIHALAEDSARGTAFQCTPQEYYAATSLPPMKRTEPVIVNAYMSNPSSMGALTATSEDYRPSLKLVNVGQFHLGATIDKSGTRIAGSANAYFGDMLGDHLLGIAAAIDGGWADLGGHLFYVNRDYRMNFGLSYSHLPLRETTFSFDSSDKGTGGLRMVRQRMYTDRTSLFGYYPLSANRRLELSTGATRLAFDEQATSLRNVNGEIVSETIRGPRSSIPLHLGHAAAAYVGDFAFGGPVSPISGHRYRFELEQTFGSLAFTTLRADMRHYLYLRPFTVGFRLLHYGRYFGDCDDSRLTPMSVGRESLVRGYETGVYTLRNSSGEAYADPLTGSRLGVANLELRLPVLGVGRHALIPFPYVPMEVAGFVDAGVAWNRNEIPNLEWASSIRANTPVFSAGAAARFNLMGLVAFQVYYAYPFQQPQRGAHFGVVLTPGW